MRFAAGLVALAFAFAAFPACAQQLPADEQLRDAMPFRNFSMPSVSMLPSIQVDARFVAYRALPKDVRRGDVIIFRLRGAQWVMRVVGLPGDTVRMVDGKVMLNGKLIGLVSDGAGPLLESGSSRRYLEQLPGEARPHDILDSGLVPQDNTEQVEVPADRFFVLGDNRDDSADSRFGPELLGAGLVRWEDLYGVVQLKEE